MRPKLSPIISPMQLYTQYLEKQGISQELAAINDIYLASPPDSRKIGMHELLGPGVVFPYHAPDGKIDPIPRVRLLIPRPGMKYWQKRGSGDRGPYLPQGRIKWVDVLADASQPIWITEGEVKAIIGGEYMAGLPVLALPGVSNKTRLLSMDIVWEGRSVVISFDHDVGQTPGTYGAGVFLAIRKLAGALIERGAKVTVCSIGKAGAAQGFEGKLGLDDYFRAGGTVEELFKYLEEPPEGCEILAELISRYVIVTLPKPVVWDAITGHSYTFQNFRDITSNKWEEVDTKSGGRMRKYKSKEFLEKKDSQRAIGFVMDPSRSYGLHGDVINTWIPFKEWEGMETSERYKAAFRKLIHTMAGEFPIEIEKWIAHYVLRPWERTTQAVLIATNLQGIGKSLLGEIVGSIVGVDNYAEVEVDGLGEKFNSHLESRTWILINELNARFTAKEGWMKNLVTREHNQIEHKQGATYWVNNLRRYMMNSNEAAAMKLGAENRRVWVCRPSLNTVTADAWKAWLREEVIEPYAHGKGEVFLASCKEALEEVDLNGFDPMAEVINGEAARDLIEDSMSANESAANVILREWMESGNKYLVYFPSTEQQYKPVFTILKGLIRSMGMDRASKVVREDSKGTRYTMVGRFDDGEMVLDTKGTKTYYGNLSVTELKEYLRDSDQFIMDGVSHLEK